MDGERDEAVESVGTADGEAWREAVRALAREPLPGKLREALVEVGAQGRRLRLAVDAYNARLDRLWADPEEMNRPARLLLDWPEAVEREDARRAWESAKQVVASFAQAWVEGTRAGTAEALGEGSGP